MTKLNNSKDYTEKSIGRKIFLPLLFILLVFFLTAGLIKVNCLIVRDPFTNEIKKVEYVKKDALIGIIYTHSVMRTQTSEWYKIEGDKLILKEERYRSQGAGLPVDLIYKFKHENGDFVLYDINEPFETVIYRTGDIRANHRLKIGDKDEELFTDFSEPREALEFSAKNMSFLNYLWRRYYIER